MSDHDAFDVLDVPVQSIDYAGINFSIQPITVGQLPAFVRGIRPALNAIVALDSVMESGGDDNDLTDVFLDLIAEHGEGLQEAMAVATSQPLAIIRSGSPVEFISLAKEVIRINRDFFDRSLRQAAADRRRPQSHGSGQIPSKSSLSEGTNSAT